MCFGDLAREREAEAGAVALGRIERQQRVGAVHPINQYVYNKRRMLVSETQHLPARYSYSTAYSYDANGSLSRIHYPSTDYVDFAPNARGQATRARNSAGHDYAANVTYHPNGAIAGFTYGNGIVHAMTQNARQLPLQVTNTGVISDSYSYDANGNVTGIVDGATSGNRTKAMTYDGLDRLLTAHSPVFGGDGYARYTYDVLDNLRSVKTATRDHTYWYDAKNQLTGVIDAATNGTVTGLDYDRSGNVQQKNGQAYDFDYGNRLREVLDVERYRYDAYGRRILAMNFTQGTITSLYSNSGQLLFQRNERVGEMKDIDHVYLAGSLIAQKETPVGGGTATIKYQHTDALGTPVVVTGAGQAVLDRVDYEPYGKSITLGNSTGKDRPGYTGHVEDRATSLTYMQQRYQDPELGVFLSVDPVTAYSGGTSQLNSYRYANSNPYRFTDPDGRIGYEVNEGGNIHIIIPVHFKGVGATPERISEVVSASNSLITEGVTIQVVSTPLVGGVNVMNLAPHNDNPYTLYGEGIAEVPGYPGVNMAAHIDSRRPDVVGAAVHDILHFVYLADGYEEGPTVDGRRGPSPRPKPGYTKDQIMANTSGNQVRSAETAALRSTNNRMGTAVEYRRVMGRIQSKKKADEEERKK